MSNQVLYGFHQLKDVLSQPAGAGMTPAINTAIGQTLREYNRQMDALLSLFVARTTQFKLRYKSPAIKRLQPLDEQGRARTTKNTSTYDVAFPIQAAGDAWGANFVTSQKLSVGDINDWMAGSLVADRRWLCDHILAALFASGSWTFADETHGDLTVMPLANGDTQTYLNQSGNTATDSHLLAQQDDISDAANPFPILHRELVEHPENGGENATIIALVSSNLVDAVERLAAFREPLDRDLRPADNASVLTGALTAPVPGVVRGKANKCWIVEWGSLPDNVILGVTLEGEKPLAMREHSEASLQGYFELPHRNDTPYLERQFQRHAGFGALNRIGAVCMTIGAANWTTPTNYGSPMP